MSRALTSLGAVLSVVAVTVGAGLINLHWAHSPRDDGWILAYGWRLVHGEVPYRDFFFVQMPLTLYLHSIWFALPDGWVFTAGRLAYYAEVTTATAAIAAWSAATRRVVMGVPALALISAGFAIGLHNFPPMPWPTVDALLFGSLGLVALLCSLDNASRRTLALRAAASLAFALAALARQSFAVLVLLLVAIAVADARRSRRLGLPLLLASVIPAALLGLASVVFLDRQGALASFWAAIAGGSSAASLLDAGLLSYVRPTEMTPVYGASAALGASLRLIARDSGRRRVVEGLAAAYLVALVLGMLVGDYYLAGPALFYVLLGAFVAELVARRRGESRWDQVTFALWCGVLLLAWAASISYGYQTPLLGLGAAGVLLAGLVRAESRAVALVTFAAGCAVLTGVATLELMRPYHDRMRTEPARDLGDVFPRFGSLETNVVTYARFAELRDLTTRYAASQARPFVVMPEFPLAYYLAGTRNPASVDWFHPAVVQGREERLLDEIVASGSIVLMQRRSAIDLNANVIGCGTPRPPDETRLTTTIASSWTLVHEGLFFCVYTAPRR